MLHHRTVPYNTHTTPRSTNILATMRLSDPTSKRFHPAKHLHHYISQAFFLVIIRTQFPEEGIHHRKR